MTPKQVLALRKRTKMTRKEFGALAGVDRVTVWRWEKDPGPGLDDLAGEGLRKVVEDHLAAKADAA